MTGGCCHGLVVDEKSAGAEKSPNPGSETVDRHWELKSPQSPPSFPHNPVLVRISTCVCNARRLQPVRLLTEGL